jgi:hypothetical protein
VKAVVRQRTKTLRKLYLSGSAMVQSSVFSPSTTLILATEMDVLVLENFVLRRTEQRPRSAPEREQFIASFPRD